MKKLLLLVGFIFLSGTTLGATENIESEINKVYDFIKKGEWHYSNKPHKKDRAILDSVSPSKLKFCKSKKTNETFTVYRNQQCLQQDRSSRLGFVKIIGGKKITLNQYISLNPDFSEENNLVCIKFDDTPRDPTNTIYPSPFHVFYLTHTPSNKVYLNSLVKSGYIIREYQDVEDLKERGQWLHQSISIPKNDGYEFIFYRYYDKDTEKTYGNDISKISTISFNTNYGFSNKEKVKCYANEEYWLAMYPHINIDKQPQEKIQVAQNTKCEGIYNSWMNCFGTYVFANGNKYVGDWNNGKRHGHGTYTYASGSKYVGEYKNGKRHGQGTYTSAVGHKYVGKFKDGDFNGHGTFTSANGSIQSGEWKNNELVKEFDITQVEEVQVAQNTTQETKTTTPKKKTEQVVVKTTSNLDKKSLKEELKYWKDLYDDELISKEEYDAKREALLEEGVVTTSQVEETKKTEVVKISKPKGDSSFKNKNYVSKKTYKDWLWEIIEFCDKNYSKAMESFECSRDNLEATKYYKKGKSSKMDLYKLYIVFTDQVTNNVIDGYIDVSKAKFEMTMFQSQIVSQIKNRISQEDAERESRKRAFDKIGQLGREMMKPGFDWTTGTSSSSNNKEYSAGFNAWAPGLGILDDEYISGFNRICIYNHLGSEVAKTIGANELCSPTN